MAHTLPALPYPFDALEPHIDAKTMEIHSQKHHKAYVDNLNKALESAPDAAKLDIVALLRDIKKVPESARQAVINNGGGHHNHSLFWEIMGPNAGGEPTGQLADAIKATFGDFAKFKEEFTKTAIGTFGSGWAWLVQRPDGSLGLVSTPNAATPLTGEDTALLTCDVWEHAYYIDYRNARPKYVEAFWNLVNWDFVAANLK